MEKTFFTLFDTVIGRCGILWREHHVVGIQLPEKDEQAMFARIRCRYPEAGESDAPPPCVRSAISRIGSLLSGRPADLSAVPLDMNGLPPFRHRVYTLARTIPPGTTLSYGELAKRAGSPGAARAVGQAMAHNPFPILVPCHRVVAAGGKTGGFTAEGSVATKLRLLALERPLRESPRRTEARA